LYAYGFDEEAGLLVGVYTAPAQSDADYQRAFDTMARADRNAVQRGVPYAHVMVVDASAGQPSPRWRQRFSELNKAMTTPTYYFAFVTSSAVIRGIFTAIRWLTGARDGHTNMAFSNFDEACAWLRRVSGNRYPQLETLYQRARSQAPALEAQR